MSTPNDDFECGLYVAPSTVPHLGRGIFTGKAYRENDTIEVSVTLPVRYRDVDGTQINNYIFGTGEDGIAMLEYGPGMLYNHRIPTNYYRVWDERDDAVPRPTLFDEQVEAYTTYRSILEVAVHDLEAGEEVFGKYCEQEGPCDWFAHRGIPFADYRDGEDNSSSGGSSSGGEGTGRPRPAKRSVAQLAAEGHCITQVHVAPSTVPGAGRGLFASRAFAAGEIVTISPVLLLANEHIDDGSGGDYSVLMNYCMTSPRASVALLPFGLAAMANHAPSPSPASSSSSSSSSSSTASDPSTLTANMYLEWFYWDEVSSQPDAGKGNGNGTRALLRSTSLTDLAAMPFTPLDIAYRATHAIAKGEELFVSYGEAWAAAYRRYDTALRAYLSEDGPEGLETLLLDGRSPAALAPQELEILRRQRRQRRPRFRHFIGDPHGLYLPHWLDAGHAVEPVPLETAPAVPNAATEPPVPAAVETVPVPDTFSAAFLSLFSRATFERLRLPTAAVTGDDLVVTLPLATCTAAVTAAVAILVWWHVCLWICGRLFATKQSSGKPKQP